MIKKLLLSICLIASAQMLNAAVNDDTSILSDVTQLTDEQMSAVVGEYIMLRINYTGELTEVSYMGWPDDSGLIIVNGDTGIEIYVNIYYTRSGVKYHEWLDGNTWHQEIL